ncbi:MAG: hypothetical protein U5J98_04190 [Halobacteriales archaeon]|nr:hypothetical protein [Halobacteriales archaeon]
MARETRYPLGEFRGRTDYLQVRATPSFDDVTDFAAAVFYRELVEDRPVEIARIDTSHGFVHFDRLYRRDRPKDPIDLTVREAAELLESNWRTYAESHDRSHRE